MIHNVQNVHLTLNIYKTQKLCVQGHNADSKAFCNRTESKISTMTEHIFIQTTYFQSKGMFTNEMFEEVLIIITTII